MMGDIVHGASPTTPLWASGATSCGGSRPSDSFLSRSEWLALAEGASTGFMIASGGVLSDGYGHGRPGANLGDGQTEAYLKDMGVTGLASVWAMARRRTKEGDALFRRMPPYLTCLDFQISLTSLNRFLNLSDPAGLK